MDNHLNLGDGTGLSGGGATTTAADLGEPGGSLPLLLELEEEKTDPTEEPLNWRRRLPLLRIPDSVSISFLLGHGLREKEGGILETFQLHNI